MLKHNRAPTLKSDFNSLLRFFRALLAVLTLAGCTTVSATAATRNPSQVANTGVIEITDASAFTAVYVVSDVHGMYSAILKNLKAATIIDATEHWSAGKSLLVIVGDSIDKGPQSLEVLSLWIRLQSEAAVAQGRVIHTLGNHEAEFLASPNDKKTVELINELSLPQYANLHLADLSSPSNSYGAFLTSEVVALRLGKWLFCHSGFYPSMAWADFAAQSAKLVQSQQYGDGFLIGANSILEAKKWNAQVPQLLQNLDQNGVYGVVFGHQPAAFNIIGRSAALMGGRLVKIDNGMAPEAGSNPGSIVKFNHPAEMNQSAYPSVSLILSTGESRDLLPE